MFDHNVIRYTIRYLSFENDLLIKEKPQPLVNYSLGQEMLFRYMYFYSYFPTLMNIDFQNRTNMKYSTHGLECCEVSLIQNFNFITD